MSIGRRSALVRMTALLAAGGLPERTVAEEKQSVRDVGSPARARDLRKVATEEAWVTPEVAEGLRAVVRRGGRNLNLALLAGIYDPPVGTSPRFLAQLLDVDELRLAEMDASGVDMHLLSLNAPGVQMFTPDVANTLGAAGLVGHGGCLALSRTEDRHEHGYWRGFDARTTVQIPGRGPCCDAHHGVTHGPGGNHRSDARGTGGLDLGADPGA